MSARFEAVDKRFELAQGRVFIDCPNRASRHYQVSLEGNIMIVVLPIYEKIEDLKEINIPRDAGREMSRLKMLHIHSGGSQIFRLG